ncbi:PLDc N-terminal domain-containing protein [Candidatus Bipolaricaulota bacterium]|nr:PLDc N-terminal domain-containing protein [Candidatus Bipolaricaulota bacterium]
MFSEIIELLPLIAPLLVIQLGLQLYCLLDLWKFSKGQRDKQDRLVWTLVVLLFSLFGALAYLVFERR